MPMLPLTEVELLLMSNWNWEVPNSNPAKSAAAPRADQLAVGKRRKEPHHQNDDPGEKFVEEALGGQREIGFGVEK